MSGGASAMPASVFVTAQDGLRLHVREYGARTAPGAAGRLPAGPCRAPLPISTRLLRRWREWRPPQRRVIAIDLRGRGQSDYDRNPENYNLAVELADVVDAS